jgi:hypothetical protein
MVKPAVPPIDHDAVGHLLVLHVDEARIALEESENHIQSQPATQRSEHEDRDSTGYSSRKPLDEFLEDQ